MKCSLRVIGVVLLLLAAVVRAEGPDDEYVRIYTMIQEADGLTDPAQGRQALAKYAEAQAALARFATVYPGWNEKVVSYRLNYVAGKLTPLLAQFGTNEATAPVVAPVRVAPSKPVTTESGQSLRQMQEELQRLQTDNVTLAAKLKEALSVQPSSVDPRELSKAEEKNKNLQKEIDLLTVTLNQEREKTAKIPAPEAAAEASRSLAATKARLDEQTKALNALNAENELLRKKTLEAEKTDGATKAEIKKRKELEAEAEALRAKLEKTEKQLAKKSVVEDELAAAKAQVKKSKELENENESLRAKLEKAEKQLAKRASSKAPPSELEKEVTALQARLLALEARPVPYTAEELAALKKPQTQLLTSATEPGTASSASAEKPPAVKIVAKKTVKELPPGAGELATAARRAFEAQRYDEAEQKFADILRQDEKNLFVLGNLAATQIEMNKLDAAERNLKTALAIEPNDDFCLYLMGRLQFLRGKMDDALTLLSRAAQENPDNAQLQNHLGIVLSEKGLRQQAEAAFRKAIQLRPGYADAHNNVAFIYASQKPPSVALARWHYQRALSSGLARNQALEKLLSENK